MNSAETLPRDVLLALEKLEAATSPSELGPAYRTLLAWRNRSAVWRSRGLFALLWFAGSIVAAAVMANRPAIPEFWRGAIFALILVACFNKIESLLAPPSDLAARVADALGRWRHLVPLMRELP